MQLHHGVAAADAEGLAGDEAGGVRGQKHHGVSYLLGRAHPAQDVVPPDPLQDLLGEELTKLGNCGP